MPYSTMCKWCMRYDCSEKGGPKQPCAVEKNEMPDNTTHDLTNKYHKSLRGKVGQHRDGPNTELT
jgi:hypothetical protein